MTSHRDHSFQCVCKNGFFGEYCEKGLYHFLIYCDSIDIENVFFFFFCFLTVQYNFIFLLRISPRLQGTEALLRGGIHGCM